MNINDIIARSESLRKETALNSVDPERVGSIMSDTLKWLNDFQLTSNSLGLEKIYASVSAMNSDNAPVSDLTGKPLKGGQLAVIVAGSASEDNGKVYRFDNPGWTYVSTIGNLNIVQETGDSETAVMSQKSVTDKFQELRTNIFLGGVPKAQRWIDSGLFDFVFDAYFDINTEDGFWYHLSGIDRVNKKIIVFKHYNDDSENVGVNAITFTEYKQFGDYSLMYSGNSYILVNWNLYLTDEILAGTHRDEGTELNPSLFRTYGINSLQSAASRLRGEMNSLIREVSSMEEVQTIDRSYIQANGDVSSSGIASTTVGVYNVEAGKTYKVSYFTANQYSLPYAFYGGNTKVTDSNYFPTVTENGILTSVVLLAPAGSDTLKIAYNNTSEHSVVEVEVPLYEKDFMIIQNDIIRLQNGIYGGTISEETSFKYQYQMNELTSVIPQGNVINLSGDISELTCRTNADDSEFQTVVDGTVADRDIKFVRNGTVTGNVTISNTCPNPLESRVRTLEDKIPTIQEDVNGLLNGIYGSTESEEVNFQFQYQMKALATMIPKGNVINLSGDVTQLTCRTNAEDSDYQTVVDGTVADRDIKFVKNNSVIGNATISSTYLDSLTSRIEALENSLNSAKEGSGIAYRMSSRLMQRPIKILGVGNSWTNNATAYLGEILTDLGVKVELNVSYAGGATLESYWSNIQSGNDAYDFRKWREGQGWIEPASKSTYKDILMADDWDIVTHQQQSGNGGNYPSFQPYLHNILSWEKGLVRIMPLFFMHATWAYPQDLTNESSLAQFNEFYGGNTDTMYNAILDAYNQAMAAENIVNVMPSAPVIQQVRTAGVANIDTEDGSHLANGQFAVACVWAEMIMRNYLDQSVASSLSIVNGTFKPYGMSDEDAATMRALAKSVVENVRTYFPNQK